MGSFAHQLVSVVMAFALSGSPAALSGSPAALSACMALCVHSPMAAASAAEGTQADHEGHGAVAELVAASPHVHHGTAASTEPTASLAGASPLVPSDARLVGSCDNCCVAGPIVFVVGLGVERTGGKTIAMAPTVSVVSFHLSATTDAAPPPGPPVPPPSPTKAPLALRI